MFCLFSFYGFAQQRDLIFEHLNSAHGLSNGNIWDIHQDSLGFMWFATEDGLNIYNGYEFDIFRNDENDTTSISNEYIHEIEEGYNGSMWVATIDGLNFYNREKKTFKRYTNDPDDPKTISSNVINSLCIDDNNNLWVGTSNGLNLYNRKKDEFKRYFHQEDRKNTLVHNDIDCIIVDHTGKLWIGTQEGLSWFDPDKETFTNFTHNPDDPNSIRGNDINDLLEDSENNIWVGTFQGGLNMFNHQDSSFKRFPHSLNTPYSISDDFVYSINESPKGVIFVSTDNGLNVLNKEDYTFSKYFHNPKNEYSLNSNITITTYFDNNDRLWVGTRFGGLNIYDEGRYNFKHFKHNELNKYSLSSNIVTSFIEDEVGNFWVGTDGGGLNYYDRSSGNFIKKLQQKEGDPNSLTSNKVLAIEMDRKGRIWIGMWNGGVSVYNPENGRFKHYKMEVDNDTGLRENNIFDVMEDSKGNMWIGTWGEGVSKLNTATGQFTHYIHDPDDPNTLSGEVIVHMMEDHLGKIWIATENNGLNMFDPDTDTFTRFMKGQPPSGISVSSIYSVYEDSKNRIWVGTNGDGLYLYDRDTKTFTVYREKDGLPNEVIKGIIEDDDGNLWLSTNKGLSKFNPERETFKNYDVNDGLQNNQFNRWAFLKLSTGELLFGGINGFNMFDPDNIIDNDYVPPVYISDIQLFNQPVGIGKGEVLRRNILFTDELVLDHNQNFLTFEFVALNYRHANQNQYKYILEGFQDEWSYADNERKVTYTNLDPGTYTFKVQGSNNDGVWNLEGDALKIIITPPFWGTWYFRAGVILLILGILFSIFYVRMKVIQTQKQELAKQVAEKTQDLSKINNELNQFAYIVSHDLKAPLRGIINLADWIGEDLEDLEVSLDQDVKDNFNLMKDRVGRMQNLIDGILNYSRVGRTKAEKELIKSREVVDEVVNILNIPEGFSIEIEGAFPEITSNRTWLEQVFTNLVNNALKYHDKAEGKITIAYSEDSKDHIFSVEDDGPGISPEYQEKIFMIFQTLQSKDQSESTGIGLTIVKKIVEEQGGTIWVESDGENGSKFIFTIPKH